MNPRMLDDEKLPSDAAARTVGETPAEEDSMGARELRELAHIRQELRERLMALDPGGTGSILDRLAALGGGELRGEVERWRLRFELLEATRL